MRLLIIADTHIPARARDLPAQLWRAVDAADLAEGALVGVELHPL